MTTGAVTESFPESSEPLLPTKRRWEGEDGGGDEAAFHEFNGASFAGAVFNLSTTIVGAGIMALPATMKVLGLVPGLVMIVLAAFLTDASVELLMRFSRVVGAPSYGAVMGDAFGDVLSGTSSGGEHHYGVLEGWFGTHWWNGRFFVLLVTTLGVFTPLACFKRVDSLSYTSAISVALAVVFVVITAGIAIVKLIRGQIPMPKLFPAVPDLASVWELFTAVPVLVTAYVCHYNVHPIHNELKESSQIKPIVHTSLALCSTVYITTSFFGYLLFGESTLAD
uniref:Amino acid transporter transmembrane domain-containing protein n=1 Tax=Aegilops tauschii subsp. strangulata TaxID=200361 RepID=A0A453RBX6_AEGTS